MIISKCVGMVVATDIVTYKFMENVTLNDRQTHSYSILKCTNNTNGTTSVDKIARNIKSKEASMLIWNDVVAGIQK